MELEMDQTSPSALPPQSEGTATSLHQIAEHVFPRKEATLVGVVLGTLLGAGNVVIGLVFPSWPATLGLLAVAVIVVVVLHEGLHGATGSLLGYRPMFGMKPPQMFTTFDQEIRRDHLLMIALAPLVILDTAFIAAYLTVPGKVFWDLCFAVNTMGRHWRRLACHTSTQVSLRYLVSRHEKRCGGLGVYRSSGITGGRFRS
jgi:hypothetical protein